MTAPIQIPITAPGAEAAAQSINRAASAGHNAAGAAEKLGAHSHKAGEGLEHSAHSAHRMRAALEPLGKLAPQVTESFGRLTELTAHFGPLGVAVAGVSLIGGALIERFQEQKEKAAELKKEVVELNMKLYELGKAGAEARRGLGGALGSTVASLTPSQRQSFAAGNAKKAAELSEAGGLSFGEGLDAAARGQTVKQVGDRLSQENFGDPRLIHAAQLRGKTSADEMAAFLSPEADKAEAPHSALGASRISDLKIERDQDQSVLDKAIKDRDAKQAAITPGLSNLKLSNPLFYTGDFRDKFDAYTESNNRVAEANNRLTDAINRLRGAEGDGEKPFAVSGAASVDK